MQRSQFEKNWNRLKDNIQNRWSKLSNEDIDEIDGMYDQFVNRVAKRYGYPREAAIREIENWQIEERTGNEETMEEESESVEEELQSEKEESGGKRHEIREWQNEKQQKQQKPAQQKWKEKKRKAG